MSLKERLGLSEEPLYLVDGSSFVYRGFYAFSELSRSDGFPTNALFIVLRLLLKLLREERPKYALFCLDGPGPTFRQAIFADYKANREAMPEPLALQMPPIREGVELLGLPLRVAEGAEADDDIAALARRHAPARPVVIVASDKDLRQLLTDRVVHWDP